MWAARPAKRRSQPDGAGFDSRAGRCRALVSSARARPRSAESAILADKPTFLRAAPAAAAKFACCGLWIAS